MVNGILFKVGKIKIYGDYKPKTSKSFSKKKIARRYKMDGYIKSLAEKAIEIRENALRHPMPSPYFLRLKNCIEYVIDSLETYENQTIGQIVILREELLKLTKDASIEITFEKDDNEEI